MTEEVESGQIVKEETSIPTGMDQCPVIDYSKELKPPVEFI
jgi:hypothetical protein